MDETYSIAETASAFGLPPSTLRYYDKEGLLPGLLRTKGGVRRFTQESLRALHIIGCLKSSGLSIQEIKEFFALPEDGAETVESRLQIFEGRRKAVQEQMQALQKTLDVLDYKCWYYSKAQELGSARAVEELPDAEVPPRLRTVRDDIGSLP